jgi:hypothetical protein
MTSVISFASTAIRLVIGTKYCTPSKFVIYLKIERGQLYNFNSSKRILITFCCEASSFVSRSNDPSPPEPIHLPPNMGAVNPWNVTFSKSGVDTPAFQGPALGMCE